MCDHCHVDTTEVIRGRRLGNGTGARIRRQAGIAQAELARAMGVQASTLCRWEAGEQIPDPRNAVRWYKAIAEIRAAIDGPIFDDEQSKAAVS